MFSVKTECKIIAPVMLEDLARTEKETRGMQASKYANKQASTQTIKQASTQSSNDENT